ncbi:ABC transporter ATP-binding protein [Paucilactobacillus suebicus]|uniref:ABC transporter ATPase n=1 Tax=Paucilactobacillus suebicus DSM 5007 = KCTC 3549 TaxID=1423807 RepID=A0A0R1W4H3_9LACO|nr:ABC transporter ATP-binding protein [Paucilactobacillus suebicus]KRM10505.1 ABC transporter ATPase [Paucilactobacillus suebicus DSM 5007 = KCTC 3549]
MTELLSIENLTYRRNLRTILTNLSLTLNDNQIVGLLGANGAGKTTLMRLIAGSAVNYRGSISINGKNTGSERKSMVSFSAQLEGVNENLKLIKIADYFNHVFPDFEMNDFEKLAANLSIDLDQHFISLSKGNRQKFVMAITLAKHAKLYLLDEPFNGIDSMSRKKIVASIIEWKPEDATILISDHHVTDIANLLDAVAIVKDHTVVTQKSADEIREENGQSIETFYESFYEEEGTKND